ncbi:MAG TPA: hypothetical protein VFN87_14530 [Solirubrobacteraceae bacterium]|nr:hypothetical protein [Solirubrobacteraceae bacterium]
MPRSPLNFRPRLLVIPGLAAALAAAAVPAGARPARADRAATGMVSVRLQPGAGGPRTTFTVSFRRRAQTGIQGGVSRRDSVIVFGPRRSRCVSTAEMGTPTGAAGTMVHVRLAPGRLGGRWCAGTFRGEIEETVSVLCRPGPARACPMVMIAPQTIGRFRFRVR